MDFKRRNYRFKGADKTGEKRNFWLLIVIGLAIGAAIIYFS